MSDYANVREPGVLGPIIGAIVVDVTQHDEEEYLETGEAYICVHFNNGVVLRVPIGDRGIDILNHPTAFERS